MSGYASRLSGKRAQLARVIAHEGASVMMSSPGFVTIFAALEIISFGVIFTTHKVCLHHEHGGSRNQHRARRQYPTCKPGGGVDQTPAVLLVAVRDGNGGVRDDGARQFRYHAFGDPACGGSNLLRDWTTVYSVDSFS
jgi:hypothetical protein